MDKTDTCIKLRNFKHCFIDIKMMKVFIKTQIFGHLTNFKICSEENTLLIELFVFLCFSKLF